MATIKVTGVHVELGNTSEVEIRYSVDGQRKDDQGIEYGFVLAAFGDGDAGGLATKLGNWIKKNYLKSPKLVRMATTHYEFLYQKSDVAQRNWRKHSDAIHNDIKRQRQKFVHFEK